MVYLHISGVIKQRTIDYAMNEEFGDYGEVYHFPKDSVSYSYILINMDAVKEDSFSSGVLSRFHLESLRPVRGAISYAKSGSSFCSATVLMVRENG